MGLVAGLCGGAGCVPAHLPRERGGETVSSVIRQFWKGRSRNGKGGRNVLLKQEPKLGIRAAEEIGERNLFTIDTLAAGSQGS